MGEVLGMFGAVVTGVMSGGATGLLGVLLQRYFDHKKQQADIELVRIQHANALELRKVELEHQSRIVERSAEADELIARMDMEAREAEAAEQSYQASVASDRTTHLDAAAQRKNKWATLMMAFVDFVRGMIRPVGTVYLMIVTTGMFWWTTNLAAEFGVKMTADQVLQLQSQLIGTITYCFVTAWVWWFGVRPTQPPKQR